MKFYLIIALLFTLCSAKENHPLLLKKAPRFISKTVEGERIKPATWMKEGKLVVISFGASYCIPCKGELKVLEELRKEMEAEFVWIDVEKKFGKVQSDFVENSGFKGHVVLDKFKILSKRFKTKGEIPMLYVITPNGVVAGVHSGFDPEKPELLKEFLFSFVEGNN